MLKGNLIDSVCRAMIQIDQTLRGKGFPKRIKRVSFQDARAQFEAEQLEAYVDEQAQAISFLTSSAMKTRKREQPGGTASGGGDGIGSQEDEVHYSPQKDCTHSDDFSSVVWHGVPHHFTATQASCVALLWAEWEKDPQAGLGLREKSIGEKIGSSNENYRLAHTFRNKGKPHPAWGTMIHAKGDGFFFLAAPVAAKKRTKKQKK